jgi:1-acyl-sn-glycerol-3-phosphate acyltransferase
MLPMHQLKKYIYPVISVPVFAVLYAYTAVAVLLVIILSYVKWKSAVFTIMGLWARSAFPIMGKRLHIHGRKKFDKHKKYILLANHASMFDIIAIMAFFPRVSWFGHERLLKVPLFGKMLRMTDYIPMTMANIRNTRRMVEQLIEKSNARTIAIFPEGTRTLSGKINPFYRGFIYLLRASGTDILPVTLNGFFRLKPKNRRYINFGARLEVVIHDPITAGELIPLKDKEIIDRVKTVIESAAKETSTSTKQN